MCSINTHKLTELAAVIIILDNNYEENALE